MKKSFLAFIGLIVSIVGVHLGWKQYKAFKEAKKAERANVVVCLRSFSYERSKTVGSGDKAVSVPRGRVSFRLVNKGGTEVTVTKVMLNPVGTWRNGRHGGLGSIYVPVNEVVPAKGVASIANLQFVADFGVRESFRIEDPESVNVEASWPGGSGPMLRCIPGSDGRWSCGSGRADESAIEVDEACD